jgi:DNA-binding MarR family transcriptional regulator
VQAHEGDEDPALTQSRIVELTGVPKQTVGAALDYLGSEGLHEAKREKPPLHLLRRTNRDSRRSNVIELTPKGRSLFS